MPGRQEHRSTFQFCENGAKAVTWEATNKRVTPEFFERHTVTELLELSDYELENFGRLTHPMAYDAASDKFRPVSWEAAFARIGQVLRGLDSPDQAEFYTSGRASNEAAYLFQLYAREYGTNNFPDCSNMCHEATSVGLPQSIGIGKGTVSLDDFERTELIISMGHNPGTNHPRMMGTCTRRRAEACRSSSSIRCASARWNASPIRRTSWKWRRSAHADRLDLFPGQGGRRRGGAQGAS